MTGSRRRPEGSSSRTRERPSTSLRRVRPGGRGGAQTGEDTSLPHRPRKRFGQHFLEPAWVARLVASLDAGPGDVFLEIGPGRGALTRPLAETGARIVAIEIDRDLAASLEAMALPNLRVVQDDVLRVDLAAALEGEPKPVRVVGNLPYNISTPILFTLLDAADGGRVFRDATLMLQKEVADRLVAVPGTSEYGSLAIQVAVGADVERLFVLPPGAFRPPPKVTSAVVRLTFRQPSVEVGEAAAFARVVRGIFLQRRKTLGNAVKPVAGSFGRSAADVLERSGLDPRRRPETLSPEEIARLTRAML